MDTINRDEIKHYFYLLEDGLTERNLKDSPSEIYNMDKGSIPLDLKHQITKHGIKEVCRWSTGWKGQITVVVCGSTIGHITYRW